MCKWQIKCAQFIDETYLIIWIAFSFCSVFVGSIFSLRKLNLLSYLWMLIQYRMLKTSTTSTHMRLMSERSRKFTRLVLQIADSSSSNFFLKTSLVHLGGSSDPRFEWKLQGALEPSIFIWFASVIPFFILPGLIQLFFFMDHLHNVQKA